MDETRSTSSDDDAVVIGRDDLTDYNEDNILPVSPEEMEEITSYLKPTEFDTDSSEFQKHLVSHLDGTGQWLSSTATYRRWHDSAEHGMLWIKGIPGSGKSVFAASLVRQFQGEDVPVLYFFFRQIIDANHEPAALLRDWLAQVLPFSPPLQVKLQECMKNRRTLGSLSLVELFKALRLALLHLPKVYCVADALDEMDKGNDEFLHALAEFGQWRPARVKVLVTSRPVTGVEMPLRVSKSLQIRLEERMVDDDIAVYVQHRLETSGITPDNRELVRRAVPGRANGLFLYAKLAMDSFLEAGANVKRVLALLPTDLNTMYTDLLREHARRSRVPDEIQLLILQWVTHATGPLRLLEIAEVINITSVYGGDLKAAKDLVRAACGPLLEVLPDETVCPVHHSLTEFLNGSTRSALAGQASANEFPVLQHGSTNHTLALACLQYLRLKLASENSKGSELKLQYPFLDYAAANWFIHLSRSESDGVDQTDINAILDQFLHGPTLRGWLKLRRPGHETEDTIPLHIAASCGLTAYAHHLVAAGADVNSKDDSHQTPILLASRNGHAEIVMLLLEHGADPSAENFDGLRPLHEAALGNHGRVINLLLNAGVDPLTAKSKEADPHWCGNAPTTIGHTALMYACQNGHTEAVNELLPFLHDIETVHRGLSWATASAQHKVVERILRHPGVDVNAKLGGDTPLFNACTCVDVKSIRALLDAGADPSIFNACSADQRGIRIHQIQHIDHESRGFTALHALCGCDKSRTTKPDAESLQDSLRLILNSGANINQQSPHGETPLHFACNADLQNSSCTWGPRRGLGPIAARALLDAGADVNVADDFGNSPLHGCISGNLELAQLLVEHGADVNSRGIMHRTPLLSFASTRRCDPDIGLWFLELKPDCNAVDDYGNGPLHLLFQNCNFQPELIRALLQAGADLNLKNHKGEGPLHLLNESPAEEDRFRFLVKAGADLELQDNEGRTILHQKFSDWWATSKFSVHTQLLALGANLNTRDFKGRTLLHQMVHQRNLEASFFLIESGMDPKSIDYGGNTLWHEIALGDNSLDFRHSPLVDRLVELGVDPEQTNYKGQTPLHLVCSRCPSHSTKSFGLADYIIRITKNRQPVDCYGATPMHIAATLSEAYVDKLLKAGADPSAVTAERLTPLHLACQSRESNVVGMLVQALKDVAERQGRPSSVLIDARDKDGRTPLHHACRSGRPETVSLLLEAGADANVLDNRNLPPIVVCQEFEEEHHLWIDRPRSHGNFLLAGDTRSAEASTKPSRTRKEHTHAPYAILSAWETDHLTTRLEEIFDMLLAHGAKVDFSDRAGTDCIRSAYFHCLRNRHDYSADCFRRLHAKVFPDNSIQLGLQGRASDIRRHASAEAFHEGAARESLGKFSANETLDRFIEERQYPLIVAACRQWNIIHAALVNDKTPLHLFAKLGLARLLQEVGTADSARKIDDPDWRASANVYGGSNGKMGSLLNTACSRQLPNMEVLKVLVENFGVDVNAQFPVETSRKKPGPAVPLMGSALHTLAEGRYWWQVSQAIPFLVHHGANIEARDEHDNTPLQVALDRASGQSGYFHTEAARELIRLGADVHAVDGKGRSSLAIAGDDLDMIRFLIHHGAEVTKSAIFAAIGGSNTDVLEALLSNNADLNTPLSPEKQRSGFNHGATQTHYCYPLHYAASVPQSNSRFAGLETDDYKVKANARRKLTILLRHGADPFASFKSGSPHEDPQTHQECTIIHSVLASSSLMEPFLELPSLELERCDAKGRTLFLAACDGSRGPDFELIFTEKSPSPIRTTVLDFFIDHHANILARDNDGRNVLHYIAWGRYDIQTSTILRILSMAPQLVHQKDSAGDTPFHYAMLRISSRLETFKAFLDAGVDILQPDSNGNTPLHCLASSLTKIKRKQAKELFKLLLDRGLSVDARNNKTGNTPLFDLMCVIETPWGLPWIRREEISDLNESDRKALRLFEEAGADFFARNNEGNTLLHAVARITLDGMSTFPIADNNAPGILGRFKFLLSKGLDPMAENDKQQTSLDIAAAVRNRGILELFGRNT